MDKKLIRIAKAVVIAFVFNDETNRLLDTLAKRAAFLKQNQQMPSEITTVGKRILDGIDRIKMLLDKEDFDECLKTVEAVKKDSVDYNAKAQAWIKRTFPPIKVNEANGKYLLMFNFNKLYDLIEKQTSLAAV